LGYIEDSGERRPNRTGKMRPVYRISALGHIAHEYEQRGYTLEEAIALATAAQFLDDDQRLTAG
jgi:hypothetical protein